MKEQPHEQTTDKNWSEFLAKQKRFSSLPFSYIKDLSEPLPELKGLDRKKDLAILKSYLTKEGYSKVLGRYRTFKSRCDSENTKMVVTISKTTYQRLERFCMLNKYHHDGIDELIEYLIDPDDGVEAQKGLLQVDQPAPSISHKSSLSIFLKKALSNTYKFNMIKIALKSAFAAGWIACKHKHAKQRSEEQMNFEAEEYFNSID